jgi:hypothetical protein
VPPTICQHRGRRVSSAGTSRSRAGRETRLRSAMGGFFGSISFYTLNLQPANDQQTEGAVCPGQSCVLRAGAHRPQTAWSLSYLCNMRLLAANRVRTTPMIIFVA